MTRCAEVVSVAENVQVTRAGAVSPPYSRPLAEEGGLAPSIQLNQRKRSGLLQVS